MGHWPHGDAVSAFPGHASGEDDQANCRVLGFLGIAEEDCSSMLEKRACILGYDLEESMNPNVECLVSFSDQREAIASVVTQYPQILGFL